MVFVPIRPGTAVRYGLRPPDPEASVLAHPLVRRGTFTINEMRREYGLPPVHWGLDSPKNGDNVGASPSSPVLVAPEFRWHYGPTAGDPDPGKMWHYDCGGEVYGFEEGHVCAVCGEGDEPPDECDGGDRDPD